LNDALEEAGLDRDEVYVTNAVKHFYFTTRLPRRQHKTPARRHVNACRPWLEAEIEVVRPEGIVCLGATAGQSLLGPTYRLTKDRGKFLKSEWAVWIVGTYHPSAILRAPTPEGRAKLRAYFVADLRKAAKRLG
jgi:DNA polymerase